jgi:esterase/lipase superfamily enzyme
MGNQVVTRSLVELANDDSSLRGKVRELVLAAPDIDADTFKQSIAPFLPRAAQRTTLYASSHDLALEASKDLQGGYRRAGDTSHGVLVIPPIQTVDASRAGGDLLGHSYVASSRTVLADIAAVIAHESPEQRKLARYHSGLGDYWIYQGQ